MAMAGYDPRGAMDLWEFMACVEEDAAAAGKVPGIEDRLAILRTHPTSSERQEALEKDMPRAMKVWKERLPKRLPIKREEVKGEVSESENVMGDKPVVAPQV
jgi:predicted Zn-dependent protease